MQIDNSKMIAMWKCPWYYYEKYVEGLAKDWNVTAEGFSAADYGTEIHRRLEHHYKGEAIPASDCNESLKLEADIMFEAYLQQYPQEDFRVLEVERTFSVELPRFCEHCHQEMKHEGRRGEATSWWCEGCQNSIIEDSHDYVGKMDLIAEASDGQLILMDHKTEKRGSWNNMPEKWATRSQASLYLWAAEQLYYKRPFKYLILNVLTRASEKGQVSCSFRRDELTRSPSDKQEALMNLCYKADEIERLTSLGPQAFWPANREVCIEGNFKCDFYDLHLFGKTPEVLKQFKPAEEYLDL